ncbi:septation ring formation regulator EzrA [Aeribacillus sp. FSL W8-0870]|uniref:septation ring formation regulator EzrA n=1 Tax=Aeribacillus sp. FSL W8-0870 TaxID=2954706 RepID=UPI0030D276CD
MEVVIVLILLIFLLFGIGYGFRKNIYKEVDRLEAWKIDIMNQSITDELSKVKELIMSGETEELFERWRKDWDDIVTSRLPNVEELLFEAEEYAEKYRFKKSKEVLLHIELVLKEIEEQIAGIVQHINDLVATESNNKTEGEAVKQQLKELKKTLLSHRHTFGTAYERLEKELYEMLHTMEKFDEEMNSGNYVTAKEILDEQKQKLEALQLKVEEIPKLLTECQMIVPNEISELKEGYKKLLEDGYKLEHLEVEKEISHIEEKMQGLKKKLSEAETEDVKMGLDSIKETIDNIYEMLEKEVYASQYVRQEAEKTGEKLQSLLEEKNDLKEQVSLVQQSYQLSNDDVDKLKELDKLMNQLKNHYKHILASIENSNIAYSVLQEELESFNKQIDQAKEKYNEWHSMLQALRKDELNARDKLAELKRMMAEIKRAIRKNNIPGLPESFVEQLQTAQQSFEKVSNALEEIPLDMDRVQTYLNDAVSIIEQLKENTDEIIAQVCLVERLIQYGNRYRSTYSGLDKKLKEAEQLFRNYEYSKSLEQAAAAIEEIDSEAMKRIQKLVENELKDL